MCGAGRSSGAGRANAARLDRRAALAQNRGRDRLDLRTIETKIGVAAAVTLGFRSTLASAAALLLFLSIVDEHPVLAQGIERLGDFEAWNAYRFNENGNAACYIASAPKKAEGNYTKRGDVFAIVTHRPAESRRDEVSFIAGYSYQTDSWVDVTIGEEAFKLFTQDDGAWAPDKEADAALVNAMIKGRDMVVKGTSSRGTETMDTYSLNGFTKAYQAINKACGLK